MPRISVLVSFSGTGGVERMISNLLRGFAKYPLEIDLLLIRADRTDYLNGVPEGVNKIHFKARHNLAVLPELVSYLRTRRPTSLLAAKDRAIFVSAMARRLARVPTRVVGRLGTNVSAGMSGKNHIAKLLRQAMMRFSYRAIDATVCVSRGVAQDLARITGLPADDFVVIRNPVVTPELPTLARERADHPWLKDKATPLIMGMGRLTRQKDFETLIKAFKIVTARYPSRLIILGEGKKRHGLEGLVHQLQLDDAVDLPGFKPNPYPYISRADLFVLSSQWEGSPNALTEAMALGVPVVSTDCPSGPREILAGGRFGPLVPVRNPEALAEAMLNVLANPPGKADLMKAVEDYRLENSASNYLRLLLDEEFG